MKNILIFTSIPSGMFSFFFEGKENYTGMPAYKEVLLKLLNDKRIESIDICIYYDSKRYTKINLPQKYLSKVNIQSFYFDINNKPRSILSFVLSLFWGIKITFIKKISSIVGFSSDGSAAAALVGFLTKTNNTRRLYGTFLAPELNKSLFRLFLLHPLEFLSYYIPHGNLFVTNDGTQGDKVYNRITSFSKNKPKLMFLLNGVNKNSIDFINVIDSIELNSFFITYVARIESWKRQHLFILSLISLKKIGYPLPRAYIVGKIIDYEYYNMLRDLINDNDLSSDVFFLHNLDNKKSISILKKSYVTFSLYEYSNLGNVFLEALSVGGVMLAINECNSLNLFPRDIFVEIKSPSVEDIASELRKILENPSLREIISKRALNFSNHYLYDWETRANIEIDYILN